MESMKNEKTVWSTVVSILSSVLAFLGIVSCCGMPVIAGILAAVGIGASQLSFFAEYRAWFIGFAIVSLLFGFTKVILGRVAVVGMIRKKPNKRSCVP